ncbi:MAG: hypothetical protein HPY76_06180 [Anaerolineae bacterium]|nr:hypothetical protein [Anaerolineae bacterium]
MDFITRVFNAITQLHPLHPITVHFPIGLTAAAALFVLLALITRKKALEQAAYFNIIFAAASSVLAIATGMRSNLINYDGGAPNALVKVVLGVLLMLILLAAILARRRNPDLLWSKQGGALYAAAYFASFAIALTLGFLGGVILYGF